MKTDNELDSLFKEKLNEFPNEVPSEIFIHDLEKRLSNSKSKNIFGYWKWYLSALLIVFSLLGWASLNLNTSIQFDSISLNASNFENNNSKMNRINKRSFKEEILLTNNIENDSELNDNGLIKTTNKGLNHVNKYYTRNFKEIENKLFNGVQSLSLEDLKLNEIVNTVENGIEINDSIFDKTIIDSNNNVDISINSNFDKEEVDKRKKWKFSVSVLNGISEIYSRKITPSLETASQLAFTSNYTQDDIKSFITQRRNIESSLTSWDFSIRLSAQKEKMVISSGFDFLRWGERITFSDTIGIQQVNSYSYLNIPLNIGWSYSRNKWQIQPFLGYSIGFSMTNSEGNYIITNNSSQNYMVSNNIAEKFVSVGQLGCLLEYLSSSGVKVTLAPILKSSISKIVNDGLIKTKYSSYGIQLGIGYQW